MIRRTVAVIQARMGSSRLPGKVLMPLDGRSILAYLCERLEGAHSLDDVIVATTDKPADVAIVEECKRHGIRSFRGSEADVLGRYLRAVDESGADIVVRVTADNPFTDPTSIDHVVSHIASGAAEYALELDLPIGTTGEAITREMLTTIARIADQPRWREHVTLFAKENLARVRGRFLPARPGYRHPNVRLSVDEPEDYQRVAAIAQSLAGLDFDLIDVVREAARLVEAEAAVA